MIDLVDEMVEAAGLFVQLDHLILVLLNYVEGVADGEEAQDDNPNNSDQLGRQIHV